MSVVFVGKPQPLAPGDLLLTRLHWRDPSLPVHLVVAAATRSRFVHGTLVVSPGEEWSVGPFGPELRPAANDVEAWAYRVNDPGWRDIGAAAARWLLERLPVAPKVYDWAGAGFVGVQALMGVQRRSPLRNAIPYCFEGITDALWQVGFDPVPGVEAGAVLGADIAASPVLLRL